MTAPALAPSSAVRTSAARAVLFALVALGLAALHLPWRPPTLCLLRATTGIPCPVCGGTTAAVELGAGRPWQALMASPLVVLGAVALVLRPLVPSRSPHPRSPQALWATIAGVALLSELWQLHRFALL